MDRDVPSLSELHTIVFDFDGVFTDNKVWVDQEGRETVCCDRGDGLALDMVRTFQRTGRLDAELFILSKEPNPVVVTRANKLKLACHHGVNDKLAFVRDHVARRFPEDPEPMSGLVYLGNDLTDLPVMRAAGFSVAPADGHPLVKAVADLVLEERGGQGFVRAFIERLLGIAHMSREEIDELVSDR